MKIFAITFGLEDRPSTRYRLLQYADFIKDSGHTLTWVHKKELRLGHLKEIQKSDVVICQKSLLACPWAWLIKAVAKRLIFDWDDAFWTRPTHPYGWWTQRKVNMRLHTWLHCADVVTCANEYLGDYARRFNKNVQVIPMSLDLHHWDNAPAPTQAAKPFVIGWAGSAGNAHYLKLCDQAMCEFLQSHPNAQYHIMCNQRPDLKAPFDFTPWSLQTEKEFFAKIDVGLLPLDEQNPFTLGKSPTKALQYMAMGSPVVGQMNKGGPADIAAGGGCISVETQQDWTKALEQLMEEKTRQQYVKEGLQNIQEHYDMKIVWEKMQTAWTGTQR